MPEAVEKQKTEAEEPMIPVGEDEKETIVSLEESNIRTVEDAATTESVAVEGSQPEEELESYSNNVKKRIDKLTRRLRETERREATALEYANNVRSEIDSIKFRANALDQNYISEYENRVTVQGQAAEKELKNALDAGDSIQIIAANKVLAQVAVEEERIRMTKQQQEVQKQQQEAYAKMAQQQQQAGQANNMRAPNMQAPNQPVDPKAEEWARKNDWFGADEVMTYASFGIHANLIEKEGFDANTDEYYDEIDKRMRNAFPHRFNEEEKPTEQRKIAQTVASANKSTGRKKKGVRLTPSQVAIAKKLNVPLEEYAKYVNLG